MTTENHVGRFRFTNITSEAPGSLDADVALLKDDPVPDPPPSSPAWLDAFSLESSHGVVFASDPVRVTTDGTEAGSVYARLRQKDLGRIEGVTVSATITVPEQDLSGEFRILFTDNYPVGSGDEWRTGLMLRDGVAALVSRHKNHEANHLTLWEDAIPFAVGREVEVSYEISVDGRWLVYIDGVEWASSDRIIPASVPEDERYIDNVGVGIDGAGEVGHPLEIIIHDAAVTTYTPAPPPVIVHPPTEPPAPDVPVAVTLNESNVGGDPFPGSSTGGYGRHITSPTRIEYATIDWRDGHGKALLVSANVELYRCHVIGGEDGIHHNGGDLIMSECIVEGLDYPSGSHSDAYQASSGGAGGTAIIEDCMLICGYRQQNAPIQINVVRSLEARRNYLWGGVYGILGDQGSANVGPLTLEDNLFAWGTQKFGTSVFGGTGVWWDPRVRPRLESPWAFNEVEAMVGFPGNGTPI